ncbi:alpha/beta hydrolase [Lichenibacterium minor]|uniref:Alpha/beta hydrolase n=1 Tax=Lichenibacterium minor TaxID=2316528 RepID=A0A4Q2U9Y1_9HYPH|nr:alpha/beta hydrolase [Lichenibacterium minor]RYC32758.1 alpha/beta hydrolase [Lichenibacterium minor]
MSPAERRRAPLWPALIGVPLAAAAGWIAYSGLAVDHDRDLPPALPGDVLPLQTGAGRAALYADGPREGVPLLLIHSVNAAASAYEVRPLYLHYRATRPVYALDLPGFGLSERPDRVYTPRVMADAVHAALAAIAERHGGVASDAIALSLSCEYLARVAIERPGSLRSIGLISPTGFDARLSGAGRAQSDRGHGAALTALSAPLWSRPLFDLVVTRASMRFFLEKTWGGKGIDEGLLDYGHASAHRPGAQHAPWSFLTGYLFAGDVSRLYRLLCLPVWTVRGMRGDFVDYRFEGEVGGRPNWMLEAFDTGAFPQFEAPGRVVASYDRFVERL